MPRGRHFGLGAISPASLEKLKNQLLGKTLNWRVFGLSYLEDYEKGRDIRSKAFGYMNALGYEYGHALAKAYLEGFLASEDPVEAAKEAVKAIDLINAHINDIMHRAPMLDIEYARQAIAEVGTNLPPLPNPEELLQFSLESQNGLYMKDFSYSVAEGLQAARNALSDFLIWQDVPYQVSFDEKKNEYVPDIFLEPSRETLKNAVKAANDEIKKRTYYGYHTVPLPDHPNVTILGWSNGAERWQVMWGMIESVARKIALRGGGDISLDANYIFVPIHPSIMEKVVEELDPLPLYDYSVEAKIRGGYPHANDQTVRKVLRAIIDAEAPDEDPEERAVAAIELWDAFVAAKAGDLVAKAAVAQFFLSLEKPAIAYTKILTDWLDADGGNRGS